MTHGGGEWAVVLEASLSATPGETRGSLDPDRPRAPPGGSSDRPLPDADRYVVRLLVGAEGPLQALRIARRRWEVASGEAGPGRWELIRTEIKAVAELAEELRPPRGVGEARVWTFSTDPGDEEAARLAYDATRQLLWIESPSEAGPVLASLLTRLGGRLALAADADALPFDLPIAAAEAVRPAAPRGSAARRRLISIMPAVSADAARAVRLAERSDPAGQVKRR